MIEWYKKVVFQNYANFNGRARRSEYWYFVLANIIVSLIIGFIFGFLKLPLLANIYSIAVFLPSIAVGVRRMHDVGKSGWYYIIPIYNLILACTEGDMGANEYGEDSKTDFSEIDEIGDIQEKI